VTISPLASNERLEFLGDAILGFVVCEMLFQQFPQYLEGELTKIKSVVVSRQTCAKISEALGLQEFLILGKGMTTTPTVPPSVLADVFDELSALMPDDVVVVANFSAQAWSNSNYQITFPSIGTWYTWFNGDSTNYGPDFGGVGIGKLS
jgi:hypothetical protein